MSEDSKMGLFGSKDKNQEQKESSKDNSPVRYNPYCMDSDTETYDTEALSMMDINDIIGVQSGQVDDSTLESEMDALSRMITDSKVESNQQSSNPKSEMQQELSKIRSSASDTASAISIDNNAGVSNIKQPDTIIDTQQEITVHSHNNITGKEKSEIERSTIKSRKYDQVSEKDTKIIDDTVPVSTFQSASGNKLHIKVDSSNTKVTDILQETVQDKQRSDITSSLSFEKDITGKMSNQSTRVSIESKDEILQSTSDSRSVVTVGSISKSLQLIGEAYISDDSEETNIDDTNTLQENSSLCVSGETSLFNIDVQQKKSKDDFNLSEQNQKESVDLNDETNVTDSARLNVETENVDNRTEDLVQDTKVIEPKISSQDETLEIQECIDSSTISNTPTCIDNELDELKEKNNMEIDTTEGILLETQLSSEISTETTEKDISVTSLKEITEFMEENQESKIEHVESTVAPGMEEQNSFVASTRENELSEKTRKDKAESDIKEITQGKNEDIFVKSVSNAQDSLLIEISNEKTNTSESKEDNLQAANNIIESSSETQKTVEIIKTLNNESSEPCHSQVNIENITITSNIGKNVDLNKDVTSVLIDKNICKTISNTTNSLLNLNEDTVSSVHSGVKDSSLKEENVTSDLNSIDLIIKDDTCQISTDVNKCGDTIIQTGEDICAKASKSLILTEYNQSISTEKHQIDEISINPKDLHSVIISESKDIDRGIEASAKVKGIQHMDTDISEAISLIPHEDKSETFAKELLKKELGVNKENQKSAACVAHEKNTSNSENVTLSDTNIPLADHSIIPEANVINILCNTKPEEDKTEETVTNENLPSEMDITGNPVITLRSSEKIVTKSDEENLDISSISELKVPTSRPKNAQDNRNICKENTEILETQLTNENMTLMVEKKNMVPMLDTSKDDNLTKSSSSNIPILQETSEAILDKQDKAICDDAKNVSEIKENILQDSTSISSETNIERLTKGLSENLEGIDDTITTQNVDSLEDLLNLDVISNDKTPSSKLPKAKGSKTQVEQIINKDISMDSLLDRTDHNETIMTQNSDYLTNVITDCLTSRNVETNYADISISDKIAIKASESAIKTNEDTNEESIKEGTDHERMGEVLQRDNILQQNDLDMSFVSDRLESVEDLGDSESKLNLAQEILLSAGENMNDTPISIENSQSSSEISELESAVKFLQESEEQTIDSPLVLSPKIVESVVEDITTQANVELYAADEADNYVNVPEFIPDSRNVGADSISISEAEIITEAAKLENERKFAAQMQKESNYDTKEVISKEIEHNQISANVPSDSITKSDIHSAVDRKMPERVHTRKEEGILDIRPLPNEGILKACELIRRSSILEERLKEPPKIEIPLPDPGKICEMPISPHDSLLIPKDARAVMYSPKAIDKIESSKVVDTSRKDSDKHDFENVSSPRIILKIAKSAIADCSEPRSPKSPKIRSTTNSPNPEDSPGQKLGKIKLKLSKDGHPSIISNENLEEAGQWHADSTSSLSPIGMKIKFSKSGDASIISGDKYENLDDSKETKHKFEESKRTESPIGMKFKLSKSGDASIIQHDYKEILTKHKEKQEIPYESPKRTESPIGMKIKLSKSGDASIIQTDRQDCLEECKESASKRTDSPIGMKIKLSKSGDASIISSDISDDVKDSLKMKEKQEAYPRTESPVKRKLSKCKGSASIISVDNSEDIRDKLDIPDPPKRTGSPLGMKIKLSKTGNVSIMHSETMIDTKEARYKEKSEVGQDIAQSSESFAIKAKMLKLAETSILSSVITEEENISHGSESFVSMKIKLSKPEDTSITSNKIEPTEDLRPWEAQTDVSQRTESPIGMKIKFSRSGDASIVQSETSEDHQNQTARVSDAECSKAESSLGVKIKLHKTGDASVMEIERKDKQQKRKDIESPLEMKIKLSKTGHPTIISCDNSSESVHKTKDPLDPSALALSHKYKEQHAMTHKETALKIHKSGSSTILQSNRSELTIEPVQMQSMIETTSKRKEMTKSPIECKKSKLEAQLSQILPEVTIQPVMCRDQNQLLFDPKTSLISRQQMNVINREISITQVRPVKTDMSISEKLKEILCKNVTNSPADSDCEIIEHRPELIIVNENSNSSQDVMIIEEMPPNRMAEIKVPKKRGRPRRNPLLQQPIHPSQITMARDSLTLDEARQVSQFGHRENERPKRTCRSQKSYAPPKRGRGRGRGKRKLESLDIFGKKPRVDQDLSAIEASTTAVITIGEIPMQQQQDVLRQSSELYKALKQPPMDRKNMTTMCTVGKHSILMNRQETRKDSALMMQLDPNRLPYMQEDPSKSCLIQTPIDSALLGSNDTDEKTSAEIISEQTQKIAMKQHTENSGVSKILDTPRPNATEIKEMPVPPGHSNWLTPISKKQTDTTIKGETVSTVQVIDEETRMSAESSSRSQTPARNMLAPASETIINEESQGSVLSTATTESEKVKVKNRRMEINFDPDEGPFTVDKIAEYEWPLDRKGETFMIQEQISQYLGVKSFKRKYPDLKRRMVDMEERNYLRENILVSEAMCDMGLTAVCSSEVLDVMCSDFPDQYEEYRKHMREKQVKEHSKKQKELTAAANAEKNRIDLAEMAVQSALSWNINLNKARKESRKCCLDLQTFTIHVPKKQQKIDTEQKISHYPVALIAGQYTDYYREYTAAELRYYPLNTVLYGPTKPNERKFDSQSEGSQSDSDSESSSDDSSSSSSEGTQDTEGSQSTMDDVDMEIVTQKDDIKLKCKMCLKVLNKHSKNEILIQCGTCNGNVHPSCIDITLDMVPHIQSYAWQCTDCKTCAQCHDPADEDKMLFCDMCDRGYHIYCVGLRRVPQGRWHCQECAVCANCGSREPGGANSDRNSVAQWQHEYKKGEKNTRVYISTLCIPCSKLWRKGRYCPHCSRCHTAQRLDLEANLVHCSACDKYLHLDCVETKGIVVDKKNYLCDFCTPSNRHQITKPFFSKMLKT